MRAPALVLAVALVACGSGPARKNGMPKTAHVVVVTSTGEHRVAVEVARTDEERAMGLMHRRSLAEDAGMLFIFTESDDHSFWMRNTLIPLDMIFIGEDGRVVGIVERAEPLTLTQRSVGKPSRYVLEVNGGWSAARGVRVGDVVRFEGVL